MTEKPSLISFRDQVIADRREAAARAIQEYRRYIAAHGERDPEPTCYMQAQAELGRV